MGPYKWPKIAGQLGLCHPTYRGYAAIPPLITGRGPPCSWKTAIFNREFQPRKMNVSHPRSGLFNRKGLSSNSLSFRGHVTVSVGVYLQRVHGKIIQVDQQPDRECITSSLPETDFATEAFFYFHLYLRTWSNLTYAYISNGLVQPPTN